MNHIKIFEQYNSDIKNEMFLKAIKGALKNSNSDLINGIIKQGFDIGKYYGYFVEYCTENDCLKSLKYVIPREKYDKYFTEEGEVINWDIFRVSADGDPDLKYEFNNIIISIDQELKINPDSQKIPDIDINIFINDDYYTVDVIIFLDCLKPDTFSGKYFLEADYVLNGISFEEKEEEIIKNFMKVNYPHLIYTV